jgi:hypothetical protein
MDQTILVGPDIEIGRDAVSALDAGGIPPAVALLAVFPKYGDWRFLLSSPSLDQAHLLRAHEQVAAVLRGEFVERIPTIMILPIKDPFVRELRSRYGKLKQTPGIRLGSQMIGNRFIDAAYIYRVQ